MSNRPVLLVLASTFPRWQGDSEPGFVHELARRLVPRFRVIALVPRAPGAMGREMMDGVEVHRYRYAPAPLETLVNDGGIVGNLKRHRWKLALVPGFVLALAWTTWRLVRRERVDVVHAHWLIPQGVVAAMLNALPGRKVPFVVTSHGADLYALKGKWLAAIKRWVVQRASAVTVVSRAMRDELARMGADTSNTSVLPMGVDLRERFFPNGSARQPGEILFVGRLVEKKGLRYLVDAMPRILERHPTATLTIAGFGPERTALEKQVAGLGLAERVRFLGALAQQDLPDFYRRAAVFVAPFVQATSGDQEGLGLVLVEAAGCGCPIVAGDVPAVRDVLGDDDAECVDPRNTTDLADAVIRILDDPRTAGLRAEVLCDRLLDRLDWHKVADEYATVLSRCAVYGRDHE